MPRIQYDELVQNTTLHPVQGADPIIEPTHNVRFLLKKVGVQNLAIMPAFVLSLLRSLLQGVVKDKKRDVIIPLMMVRWCCTTLPLWIFATLFMTPTSYSIWTRLFVTVLYYLLWFDTLEVYILGLHCLVHRPTWTPGFEWLNTVYVWVLGPACGMAPETYYSHHIGIHHPMNNGFKDISSTMMYQRDHVPHFLWYAFKFQFCHYDLTNQLLALKNVKRVKSFWAGECALYAYALLVTYLHGGALYSSLVFVVLPMIITRLGMTTGNWGQHAFLNPKDPYTNHNQSAVIVNSIYNRLGFNDGYHIMHHCHPTAHYTELPLLFASTLPELAANDSIVFDASKSDGLLSDWVSVGVLLLMKRYDVLAKCFVDVKAIVNKTAPRPVAEIEELLKQRVRRVYKEGEKA